MFTPETLRRITALDDDLSRIDGVREVTSLATLETIDLGDAGLTRELLGVLWTTGAMVLTGAAYTLGTVIVPPLLLCVGIADSIHIVTHFYVKLSYGRRGGTTGRLAW